MSNVQGAELNDAFLEHAVHLLARGDARRVAILKRELRLLESGRTRFERIFSDQPEKPIGDNPALFQIGMILEKMRWPERPSPSRDGLSPFLSDWCYYQASEWKRNSYFIFPNERREEALSSKLTRRSGRKPCSRRPCDASRPSS